MFPVEAFQRTIEKFVQIASAIDLPFHLTGGSISSAYGRFWSQPNNWFLAFDGIDIAINRTIEPRQKIYPLQVGFKEYGQAESN